MTPRAVLAIAPALLLTSAAAVADIASFTQVPVIPGNDGSAALGVSANGQYIVGWVHVPGSGSQPFRWNRTVESSVQNLGASAGHILGDAVDISDDGNTVVGNWRYQNIGTMEATHAFRWRQATGYQFMNAAPGHAFGHAMSASSNGGNVVGVSVTSNYGTRTGGRWASGSAIFTSTASGTLYDISASGAVAVGMSDDFSGTHAVRWTASGLTDLGVLPGKSASYGYGITRDGTKLVGMSGSWGAPVGSGRAFMWTETGGMQDLGILAGASRTTLTRINDAGTFGIGYANYDTDTQSGPQVPVVWRAGAGFMRADQFIAGLGISPGSMSIYELTGISGDGTVVTGYGHTPIPFGQRADGFVVTVPGAGSISILATATLLTTRKRRHA